MFNLQGSEIIFILLIALVVLGPEKLPEAVRKFTNTYNELRKMGSGLQSELKSVIDEPAKQVRETAALFQDAATPDLFGSDGLPGDETEFYETDGTTGTGDPSGEEARRTEADDSSTAAAAQEDQLSEETPQASDETATDETATDEPPPRPVNTIAAANSSAGLAARAAAMERAKEAAAERNAAAAGQSESGVDGPTREASASDGAASA